MKHYLDIALFTIAGLLGAAPPAAGQAAAVGAVMPAIDTAAPAAFETATFALG
jgi:hypothetical protein